MIYFRPPDSAYSSSEITKPRDIETNRPTKSHPKMIVIAKPILVLLSYFESGAAKERVHRLTQSLDRTDAPCHEVNYPFSKQHTVGAMTQRVKIPRFRISTIVACMRWSVMRAASKTRQRHKRLSSVSLLSQWVKQARSGLVPDRAFPVDRTAVFAYPDQVFNACLFRVCASPDQQPPYDYRRHHQAQTPAKHAVVGCWSIRSASGFRSRRT